MHSIRLCCPGLIAAVIALSYLPETCNSSDAIDRVLKWIQSEGGSVSPNVEIREGSNGERGIYAVKDVPPREIIFSIPYQCILTPEVARTGTYGAAIDKAVAAGQVSLHGAESELMYLTSFLLELASKTSASQLATYAHDLLEYIKRAKHIFPVFWSETERDELRGTWALTTIQRFEKKATTEFHILTAAVPDARQTHSLEEYMQARVLVKSRAFQSKMPSGSGKQAALYPLIDIANHFLPPPMFFLDAKDAAYHLIKARTQNRVIQVGENESNVHVQLGATRAIQTGMEVTNAYGMHGNEDYLTNYGFVVPWIWKLSCLASTQVKIRESLLDSARASQRGVLLSELPSFKIDSCLEGELDQLFGFARFWLVDVDEAQLRADCLFRRPEQSNQSHWTLSVHCAHLTRETELSALELVSSAVAAMSFDFAGGSVDDDERLLSGDLFNTKEKAILLRRDEKFVLQQIARFLELARAKLTSYEGDTKLWRIYQSDAKRTTNDNRRMEVLEHMEL